MTYHLDSEISKIHSPIVLCIDNKETLFANGQILSQQTFEKRYAIQSIIAKGDRIVIVLEHGIETPNPEGVDHTDMGIAD